MTTTTQQESRSRITANDFQRRGATENQRAVLRGMWGMPHTDRGIYIPTGEGLIPEGRSKEERWCERCKKTGRIMQWMDLTWFRCCGWVA